MAARIKQATGQDVELIRGSRGVFIVKVAEEVVATKTYQGFPEDADCVAAVVEAL